MLRRALALFVLGTTAIFACAEGNDIPEDGGGGSGGAITGVGGGATNATTGKTTGAGQATGGTTTGGTTNSTTASAGTGMSCDYMSPDTCQTAEIMPEVAGDQDGPIVTRTGDNSKWFKVHIVENDSNVFETDLSYRVTLNSPPGMNYDLKVHQGPQDGSPDCAAPALTGAGNPESVSASWDDDQGFTGEDDSLWLNIEVVYVSGTACGPNAQWTLTVEGNI